MHFLGLLSLCYVCMYLHTAPTHRSGRGKREPVRRWGGVGSHNGNHIFLDKHSCTSPWLNTALPGNAGESKLGGTASGCNSSAEITAVAVGRSSSLDRGHTRLGWGGGVGILVTYKKRFISRLAAPHLRFSIQPETRRLRR